MTNSLNYEVELMNKHRRLVTNFCHKEKITPYQLLLLKVSQQFTNTYEVQHWLASSDHSYEDDILRWYNNKLEGKNYTLSICHRNIKQQLEVQKGVIKTSGTSGKKGKKIEVIDEGVALLNKWDESIQNFLENQEARIRENETIYEKVERNIKSFKEKDGKIFIDLKGLDEDLVNLLKTKGEDAYLKLAEVLVANMEELQDPNSLLPIFYKVPKKGLSSDYLRNGLCKVKGWITGHSQVRELKLGRLYRCEKKEEHITIETDPANDVDFCPYCSASVKKIKNLTIPVREITLETKDQDRLTMLIHAELWNPSTSPALEQNVVMFKLSDKFSMNIRGSPTSAVNYLAVGVEIEKEPSLDVDRARVISEMTTKEIVSSISNSLYSDIAGIENVKAALVLGMGSINLQKLKIFKKGVWQEERGILNVLFWGVEGTAKTAVCQRIVSLCSHRLSKGQAGNTSARGLTAAYDSETRSVRAGIIPLNDTRVCLIDELDKFNPGTFQSLLEPLESKTLTYSKAGLNVQFPSRTVVFMTANNINEISSDCLEQLKKEIDKHGGKRTPIIDRCDIIVVIRMGTSGRAVLTEWLKSPTAKIIPTEDIQNFYEVVRTITEVKVDSDVLEVVSEEIENLNVNIMPRRLNTILRLSASIAKLHLRDIVSPQDAKDAIEYYMGFLETIGEINYVVENIDSESKTSKVSQLVLEQVEKAPLETDDLQLHFTDNIKPVLMELRNEGLIYKDGGGIWRRK